MDVFHDGMHHCTKQIFNDNMIRKKLSLNRLLAQNVTTKIQIFFN